MKGIWRMPLGYKARSLQRIRDKGLPSLWWISLPGDDGKELYGHLQSAESIYKYWAVRTDAPVQDGSKILPLFGTNKGDKHIHPIVMKLRILKEANPEYSFVVSEAPDDSTRDSNVVCWFDAVAGILYGEIGFQPMTLRDAWVRGKLYQFVIDGSAGDYIRNSRLAIGPMLSVTRVEYLRELRRLLVCYPGYEYEISVTHAGRIIFWQESPIKENRDSLFIEYLYR